MKIRASICCITALGFLLAVSEGRTQSSVLFGNYVTGGWAEPWYGGVGTNGLYTWVCSGSATSLGVGEIATSGGLLAGTGYTAELFGGPEGSQSLGFMARTTFFTGNAAGLMLAKIVPVTFAQPGQRVALQLRVYENRGGQLTSWAQASTDYTITTGTSDVFTSEPLGATPVTLQGMGSYALGFDFIRVPVPVLTLTTGGIIQTWRPIPIKFWELPGHTHSVIVGDTVTLMVEAPNPATSLAWSYNGESLPGQTNQSLVLSNIQPAQAGEYSVRVTANFGFTRTNSTRLLVTPPPILEEARRDSTGAFTARLRGVDFRFAAIESSTDLQNWVRGPRRLIATNVFSWGGLPRRYGHLPTIVRAATVLPRGHPALSIPLALTPSILEFEGLALFLSFEL